MTKERDTLIDLAERCEIALRPDRSYDVAIFQALGAPVPFQVFGKIVALEFDEAKQCYTAPIGDMRVRYEAPHYTASLDAALMLVPENYSFAVGRDDLAADALPAGAWAWCRNEYREAGYTSDLVVAKTPAFALCAAALYARANR